MCMVDEAKIHANNDVQITAIAALTDARCPDEVKLLMFVLLYCVIWAC